MKDNFEPVEERAAEYGDFDGRLRLEIPFFARLLRENNAQRVCDGGCGKGRHTLALAREGFDMVGVDPSAEAIGQARLAAEQAGLGVEFDVRTFQSLDETPGAPFDAVIALGNCLSLVGEWSDLDEAVGGIARALHPGGCLILQVPNYGLFDRPENRWKALSESQSSDSADPTLRIKHFAPWGEDFFAVEFLTVQNRQGEGWTKEVTSARVLALTRERLEARLAPLFSIEALYGGADGQDFKAHSPDLIAVARRVTS